MATRWSGIGVLLLAALAAGLPAGCQSTQDKSSRLEAQGKGLLAEHGVAVARRTKDVEVLSTAVIRDQNGTAAVVKLHNVSNHTLWNLPITIDVRGARGRSVFRNDAPGLEPTLAHVPLMRPGETLTWVNDQIEAADTARSVKATVGAGSMIAASRLPRIVLSSRGLQDDPVSGFAVVGSAYNRSKVELRKVVVFAVARRHGRVVAAGKGQIARLKPGKKVPFQAFLIGDPRGASIELSAPPPNLR
jgi:type III secretion system FlhB-like substrate exporter